MPVMTIKARGGPSGLSRLVALANEKAAGLLDSAGDRVLVVYGKQAANIYYEGTSPKVKLS